MMLTSCTKLEHFNIAPCYNIVITVQMGNDQSTKLMQIQPEEVVGNSKASA